MTLVGYRNNDAGGREENGGSKALGRQEGDRDPEPRWHNTHGWVHPPPDAKEERVCNFKQEDNGEPLCRQLRMVSFLML